MQPGHSFHSVEEVAVIGDGQKGGIGARVSLSGWFHKPIDGEEGYEGSEGFMPKSSLQQLVSHLKPILLCGSRLIASSIATVRNDAFSTDTLP